MKRAFITGISGMDGSHLAELLLDKGYEVHGLTRRSSTPTMSRIAHLVDKICLHTGDLADSTSLMRALEFSQPDEIYNLAAQSFVKASFDAPVYTVDITGLGVLRLLEAFRHVCPRAKFYHASSSEMFGLAVAPQHECSPFLPQSPYAIAKVFAHHICRQYRESYGLFICCGINFNHESPRRGEEFVTRKITRSAARIAAGLQETLELGNIAVSRDWSYAPDVMRAAWLMLQQERPDNYVVASGESHTVEEWLTLAFQYAEVVLPWKQYVKTNVTTFERPSEVSYLQGNITKAQTVLGWSPTVSFRQLVELMVEHDRAEIKHHHSSTVD